MLTRKRCFKAVVWHCLLASSERFHNQENTADKWAAPHAIDSNAGLETDS